jgi:hypothetical protein
MPLEVLGLCHYIFTKAESQLSTTSTKEQHHCHGLQAGARKIEEWREVGLKFRLLEDDHMWSERSWQS